MNEDILKGKWLEMKGGVKEKWGKLTNNDPAEIEGKGLKLLGLLRKRYGYIKYKTELEDKDSIELLEIVTSICEIMKKKKDFMPFGFIARYGQPLFGKIQESQITGKEEKHGYDTDRYFDTRLSRRNTHMAPQ